MGNQIRALALLCGLLASGRVVLAAASADPSFQLTATAADLAEYFPAYLANGYVSTVSSPRGTQGTLTHMVALMDYQRDDFSRPAAVPAWTEIDYSTGPSVTGQQWLNRVSMSEYRFKDYRQVLDLHEATLSTHYRYVDGERQTLVDVTTLVSEASPHLGASRLTLTPDFDGTVELSFAFTLWAPHEPRLPLGKLTGPQMEEAIAARGLALKATPPATADRAALWYPGDIHLSTSEGDASTLSLWLQGRAEQGLSMAEAAAIELPAGLKPDSVSVYRSPYRLALNLSVKVEKGHTYTFTKYAAFSREGWGGDAAQDLELARAARSAGFEELLRAHREAWSRLWQTDILIDGDARAQRTVHSELYYLLASSTADTAWPLGACGLTTGYSGHAFWDSDTWIYPALLLTHPERAKSLVMFRDRTLGAAEDRARAHGYAGAMFPWESDPENGTEQTPHFAAILGDREIHVTADVAIAQWQYYLATQDRDWLRRDGWPLLRAVAQFWTSRATYVPQRHRYEILHVTSVNEPFSDVPNDTFTNVSAAKALRIAVRAAALVGEKPDPRWSTIARGLYVPMSADGKHHIDFDPSVTVPGEPWGGGSSLTLLMYPSLDLPMSAETRRNDYAYGVPPIPASQPVHNSMGLAPASIAAAEVGNLDEASAWFQRNFTGGTLKPPFDVRTEGAGNNTGYFLTASGGYLQNLLYGFTGLRIEEQGLAQAFPPLLPTAWKSLTLRNIEFRGERLTIRVARDADGTVRLTRIAGGTADAADAAKAAAASGAAGAPSGPFTAPFRFGVREGLNRNEFLRDGKVAVHVLLRSGKEPRFIAAFPAGNSGVGLWFAPLAQPADFSFTEKLSPVVQSDAQGRPLYGVSTAASIAAPALEVQRAVLSSVRVLRDYQGLGTVPSEVEAKPKIQADTITWARDRLDGAAGYLLTLRVTDGSVQSTPQGLRLVAGADGKIAFGISAASGETPLTALSGSDLLNDAAAPDAAARDALTFLSYGEKFIAGSWRFDTYFGRDTLMSVRLLMPALNPAAVEAGLGAVLARLSPAGEVAHEESIGEFAVLDHLRTDGTKSDAAILDYKMIDGSYLLAPVARAWLLDDARGRPRAATFLAGEDGRGAIGIAGAATHRRGEDLVANLRLVIASAAAFAAEPSAAHLIGLKPGFMVGNWRDSNEGLGRGRYPYDVNAVLVPAALEAASRFLASGLLDPYLSAQDRVLFGRAAALAQVWRQRAPPLFDVRVPPAVASADIRRYAAAVGVPAEPALAALAGGAVRFHALSLEADGRAVPILNSDEGFALLFADPGAADLLQVSQLLRPFPAGLMTGVGMLVANPVYATAAVQERFSRNAYHGTVVWSWQQALMAAGLARQLRRGDLTPAVRAALGAAQATLWQGIEASRTMNNSELWSWSYADGRYGIAPFGAAGADADESNAAQLWSTVYLAVHPPGTASAAPGAP
jgi:trehalose/maltose hydrolase-like predicted phosphorylase